MNILRFFIFFLLSFGISFSVWHAGFFDSFISSGTPEVRYCSGGDCGLQEGIDAIEWSVTDLETSRSASEYIQDIVRYLLTFVTLIAVLYIIYAGFQILIWWGDEEKLKSSKQMILYVILGIIVMWLAWPITLFILNVITW